MDFAKSSFELYRDDDPIDLEEENSMDEIQDLLADRREKHFAGPAGDTLSQRDINSAKSFRQMDTS